MLNFDEAFEEEYRAYTQGPSNTPEPQQDLKPLRKATQEDANKIAADMFGQKGKDDAAFNQMAETSLSMDPEQEASAYNISNEIGVPVETVRGDLGIYQQLVAKQKALTDFSAIKENTGLSNLYTQDGQLAAMSVDDAYEQDQLWGWVTSVTETVFDATANEMRLKNEVGDVMDDTGGLLLRKYMFDNLSEEDNTELATLLEATDRANKIFADRSDIDESIALNGAEIWGQFTSSLPVMLGGAAVGAGTGYAMGAASGPGGAITAGTGALVGSSLASGAHAAVMEAGHAVHEFAGIKDLDGNFMDQDVALGAGMMVGLINGTIEAAGFGVLAKFSGAKKVLGYFSRGAIRKELIQNATLRKALKNAGKAWALGIAEQTVEEVLQESVNMLTGEMAKMYASGDFKTMTKDEAYERLGAIMYKTATGSVMLSGGTATPQFLVDVHAANKAESTKSYFQGLAEKVTTTKLHERAPKKLETLVNAAADKGPKDTVYVDALKLVETLANKDESGQTLNQDKAIAAIEEEFPSLKGKVGPALASNTPLRIPMGEYAANIAPTELHKALIDDIKFDETGMTFSEATDWRANGEKEFTKEMEKANKKAVGKREKAAPAEKVFDEVVAKLIDSGQTKEVAGTNAATWKAFFNTMAHLTGGDAYELYSAFDIDVDNAAGGGDFQSLLSSALERRPADETIVEGSGNSSPTASKSEGSAQDALPGMKSTIPAPPSTHSPTDSSNVSIFSPPSSVATSLPSTLPSSNEGGSVSLISGEFFINPSIQKSSENNKAVWQLTDELITNMGLAEQGMKGFENDLKAFASLIDGVELYGVRVKDEAGLLTKKLSRGSTWETINDYLGGRLVISNEAAMAEAMRRLEESGVEILEKDNFLHKSKKGYRAVHYTIRLPNGLAAELQLVPTEISNIQDEMHKIHDKWKAVSETLLTDEQKADRETDRDFMQGEFDREYQNYQQKQVVLSQSNNKAISDADLATGEGFFITEGLDVVSVAVNSLRTVKDAPERVDRAEKGMLGALNGGQGRKPISVMQEDDGTYTVLSGRSTASALKRLGVKNIPVRIQTMEEVELEEAAGKIGKMQMIEAGMSGEAFDASHIDEYIVGKWVATGKAHKNPDGSYILTETGLKMVEKELNEPTISSIDKLKAGAELFEPGINLEFAPDPRNETLTAKFKALSPEERLEATKAIADAVIPEIMKEMGIDNYNIETTEGGFEDDVNPSLILRAPELAFDELIELANVAGFVGSQQATIVYDESDHSGTQTGFIKIKPLVEMDENERAELYQHLHEVIPQVEGYTYRDGAIVIGNFSGWSDNPIDDDTMYLVIAEALEAYDTEHHFDLQEPVTFRSEYLETNLEDTRYGYGEQSESGRETSVRGQGRRNAKGIKAIKREASQLLESRLNGGKTNQEVNNEKWQKGTTALLKSRDTKLQVTTAAPDVFSVIDSGVKSLALTNGVLKEIQRKHPDVPAEVIANLRELVTDPEFVYRRTIPGKEDEVNIVIKGRTAKGETIVVGVHPATGMIKTVTPRHDQKGPGSGRAHLAKEIGNALKGEKKMYIENKAALSELEAAQSRPIASVAGGPKRLSAKVVTKSKLVNNLGRELEQSGFNNWFGDSKIVDDNGEPLVAYHSTKRDITEFKPAYDDGMMFFTTNAKFAGDWIRGSGGLRDMSDVGKAEALAMRSLEQELYPVHMKDAEEYDWKTPEGVAEFDKDRDNFKKAVREKTGFDSASEFEAVGESQIMPVYLKVEKLFDPRKDFKVVEELLLSFPEENGMGKLVEQGAHKQGSWIIYERPEVTELLQGLGYDGILLAENIGGPHETIAVWDNTLIKSASGNNGNFDGSGNILNQTLNDDMGGDTRGNITLPDDIRDGTTIIRMFEGQDLSTFQHESAHFFLEVMRSLAMDPMATPEMIKQWTAVSMMLDMDPEGTTTVEQHETFARTFEAYLFEGKAPNMELRKVFNSFLFWLKRVYEDVKNLNVVINDDVRAVMDRVLATEKEIEAAKDNMHYRALFDAAAAAGMDEDQYNSYTEALEEANEGAIRRMEMEILRDVSRETKLWWREEKKKVAVEAEDEINQQKVHQVIHYLMHAKNLVTGEKVGKVKMSRELAEEVLEGTGYTTKDLPGGGATALVRKGEGVRPELVAELYGYSSAQEMLLAIIKAPKRKEEIKARTKQMMIERHGDLLNDGFIEEKAMEIIHSDGQAKVLELELMALSRRSKTKFTPAAIAKNIAREILSGMTGRDIKPNTYAIAERKAARAAEKALIKSNYDEAARQKRIQLINHELYRAALEAKEDVDKARKYFKSFEKGSKRKRLDRDYLTQIDRMLERFELGKISGKQKKRRESLAEWIKSEEEKGNIVDLDERLLDETYRNNIEDMQLGEIMALKDAVTNIEKLAVLKNKLQSLNDQRELDEIVEDVAGELEAGAKGTVKDNPEMRLPQDEAGRAITGFLIGHRKLSSIVLQMVGGKRNSTLWKLLVKTANKREEHENNQKEAATITLTKLFQGLSVSKKLYMKIWRPEIGESLTKQGLLMIALNQGNQGNKTKLVEGQTVKGWSQDKIQKLLDNHMTKEDWEMVQGTLDFINSYWEESAAKQYRLTGIRPEKVEAMPIVTPYGTFAGGYFPLKYEDRVSERALVHTQQDIAKQMTQGMVGKATTKRGHLKGRVDNVQMQMRLDFGVIFEHVGEVIHDQTYHEWLVDINKLISHSGFRTAVVKNHGVQAYGTIKNTISDIAAGDVPAANHFEQGLNWIRAGTSIGYMGWSVWTSMLQPMGLTQSIVRIGPKWVAKGISRWLTGHEGMESTTEWIFSQSDFMRQRTKTMNREINEIRNKLQKSGVMTDIEDSYFWLIGKTQLIADIPTWLGEYEKQKELHNMSDEDAAALADQAVIDSQGSGGLKDMAQLQRGGPLQKLWTAFYSYFNVTYNLTAESYARTDFKSVPSVGRLAVDFMLLHTLPSAMATIMYQIVKGDCEDPECLAKQLVGDHIGYTLGMVLGLRELGGIASGFGYTGPSGINLFGEVAKAVKQWKQGEVDESWLKSTNKVAGILLHYPASQIERTIRGMYHMANGNTTNPMAPLVGPAYKDTR